MARRRKFQRGPEIMGIVHLLHCLKRDGWVFMHHKPMHRGWIESMPLRTVLGFSDNHFFYEAIKNEEE